MIAVTTPTMPDGTPQGPWHPTVADFRAYVERHQARMLHHAAQAVAASNEWRTRDAELAVKFKAMRLDRFEIADRKGSDPDLADAWSAYSFHSGKAQLHSSVLQGLAAAQSLLSAGSGDDGFGYSREDDEPPAAVVPAGVELHPVGSRRPMDSPDRAAHPGTPIRSARSGAKLGAAGLGDLAAPTRGGEAA